MDDDQQFCLRWNNHQSTLISVFDKLLEKGMHVDCTLAAEGQTLKAHKVVLSACSPYFEAVLSQQYDKHPIIILKDVKFAELRAMMDYMYRGEVNISQDQLSALLKAAESLQIKGLSDNKPPPPPLPLPPRALSPPPKVRSLRTSPGPETEEGSREGSISPARRKRKRRRTSQSPAPVLAAAVPAAAPPSALSPTLVPATASPQPANPPAPAPALPATHNDTAAMPKPKLVDTNDSSVKLKTENNTDLSMEPKYEYEDGNEDSVEDLTMDEVDSDGEPIGAGTSQTPGDLTAQGYAWHMDRSQDELSGQEGGQRDSQDVTLPSPAPQKLNKRCKDGPALRLILPSPVLKNTSTPDVDAKESETDRNINSLIKHRITKRLRKKSLEKDTTDESFSKLDISTPQKMSKRKMMSLPCAQYITPKGYKCPNCQRTYNARKNLVRHVNLECKREPQYKCPYCPHGNHRRNELKRHMAKKHKSLEDVELRREVLSEKDKQKAGK